MLKIFVPTRGRVLKQKSMKSFCLLDVPHDVRFLVPKCEHDAFERAHPSARLVSVPDHWKTGSINQWIASRGGRCVIIDDDLTLQRRRDPASSSQKGSASRGIEDAVALFERIEQWFNAGYAHGGVSMSNANHYCREASAKNTRACGLIFFDAHVLEAEKVRFDAVQEHQALHVTLSLLELGYPNVVDYEFMFGHAGTNAAGGCSVYRTVEYLEEQNRLLQSLHPKGISLFYRQLKGKGAEAISGPDGIPAVRVGWSKSFGIRRHERRLEDPYVVAD